MSLELDISIAKYIVCRDNSSNLLNVVLVFACSLC